MKIQSWTATDEAIVRDRMRERLLGERLRELRQRRELTQSELAKIAGKSKQLVSAWEAGRAEMLSSTLAEIARNLEVDLNWLLTGESKETRFAAGEAVRPLHAKSLQSGVPLLDQKAMWEIAREAKKISDFPKWREPISVCSERSFAFEVFDDAMTPKIAKGDITVVDKAVEPEDGDYALFALPKKNRLLFRKYMSNNPGCEGTSHFDLVGTNTEYKQLTVLDTEKPVLLGTMVECIRIGRR